MNRGESDRNRTLLLDLLTRKRGGLLLSTISPFFGSANRGSYLALLRSSASCSSIDRLSPVVSSP